MRHVAACLWPSGGPGNAELHEGRERDAVFVTDDAVHVVEATASCKKQKVIDDCKKTLGLPPDAIHLFIGDVSEEQVRLYLEKLGQTVAVPDWLPYRPLLLGHLATRGLLGGLNEEDRRASGQGWHSLITMICEREAALPRAEITAAELRDVLARIATMARRTEDGSGRSDPRTCSEPTSRSWTPSPGMQRDRSCFVFPARRGRRRSKRVRESSSTPTSSKPHR